MAEANTKDIIIERNTPKGMTHPIAKKEVLGAVDESLIGKQDMLSLATYLRQIAGKPRGREGGATDLNSHFEEFIVREGG